MIPEHVEALALADAVGALDADEQRELRSLVAALPPEARQEVARLYDSALALAASVPQIDPPPRVRERVLAAVQTPGRYTVWAHSSEWVESGLPGIRLRVLAVDRARGNVTMALQADPGAVYPPHRHSGPEECYVLKGSVMIDGRVLRAGDFHHADEDSDHGEITTSEGAEVIFFRSALEILPGTTW
jgi:anti-sigma factor ChrR (cupin superfamily)